MTNEHTELLKNFLKDKASQPGWPHQNILFYDTIDDRRVELSVWYEKSDDKIYIAGDDSQIYSFNELDLVDELLITNS